MRTDKRSSQKPDKKMPSRVHRRGIVGYSKKSALLEEAITHMNTGKYGRSSAVLKELLALDPQNIEARHLFATLHLRLGSLVTARQAFESLANEAIGRQDYWLAESLLGEYLAAGPRCVPFLEQLAHVHQEKGDEMAAVAELGKAIEILRDDPDPDNPQKAAQLYAKIRELAPASPVAFQLAPLFDVQTGELLGGSSTSATIPDADPGVHEPALSPDADSSSTVAEHPLPDVMPWDATDESDTASQAEEAPSAVPEAVDILEPPPLCEAEAEKHRPATESPLDQTAGESASEEPSFAYSATEKTEDVSSEPSSDSSLSGMTLGENPPDPPSGISSPMPWEQMGDASVQIVEPEIAPDETPLASGLSSDLESILASLRTEGEVGAPASAIEEVLPFTVTESAPLGEPTPSETGPAASALLSAPMPWEQISDPAIQISLTETAPTPRPQQFESNVSAAAPDTLGSPVVSDPARLAQPAAEMTEGPPTELAHTTEPLDASAGEISPATSFSWNSVFDKAWKFTAGTMAPSPTVPSEAAHDTIDEPQVVETQAVESSFVEPPMVASPCGQENLASPVEPEMSVSFSTNVHEQIPQEIVSVAPVESPPTPAEPSSPQETPAHWNTGEVAVQVHRPSKKRKRWEKEPEQAEHAAVAPPTIETSETSSTTSQEASREWKSTTEEPVPTVEKVVQPPARPDWMQATESITFARPEPLPTQARWSDADTAAPAAGESASAAVVSAVETLFSPSATVDDLHPHLSWSKPRPRLMARLHRVRIAISSFIGSCFSTTRSLTFLALMITIATVVVAAAGVGAVAVMWMVMEEPPSSLYHTLTISPPRVITDAKKNGYLLLLGFDAPDGRDPVQAGYERKADPQRDRVTAQVCIGDEIKTPGVTGGASDHVVKGWIRNGDLVSNLKGQGATMRSLTSRESTALARYQQWLAMPFDDWGFGQLLVPNCTRVLLAHRLFVLDGFNQDLPTGLDRLEADFQAWRVALAQSKTLTMKMLAVTAVQDDASVAAGLLSRGDLDGGSLTKLSKMVRPLDQAELSIRWPMQSQFVWATKAVSSELRDDQAADRPWHASFTAAMRLPVQRRANAYAEYYEAAKKTVAGSRYTNLPKLSTFVQTPPSGVMDYLTNPIEHIVGIEPLPSWDPFVMRMVEVDAQLRLVGLQAWLRRGPQDSDVPMRLAKAGQAYYDPFTGLPMLVNQRKGVIYSVGRDGKDQEGDDVRDVTAVIPLSFSESRRSASLR